jgi:hypothetical protein
MQVGQDERDLLVSYHSFSFIVLWAVCEESKADSILGVLFRGLLQTFPLISSFDNCFGKIRMFLIVEVPCRHYGEPVLFGRKNKLQVDLGDLENEIDNLSSFLKSNLNVDFVSGKGNLFSDSEKVAPQELQKIVTKFLHRRNLSSSHWASLEGSIVKINKFKIEKKKPEKQHKKNSSSASSITQSWGL